MSQADFIARLVDGLVRGGARRAILSPGYRNAPVALALRAHPEILTEVIVDERAAAFFALGLARASGEPVILSCTSGSAVANYLPAICEAHSDRIPLVILSADRPPELQRAGAPQTMPQRDIFADFVVYADELYEPPALDEDLPRSPWDARIAIAIAAATADEGGPVHLNLPLRKPLLPETLPPLSADPPRLLRGRRRLDPEQVQELAASFAGAERPVIVAGPMIRQARGAAAGLGDAIARLAERSGWPLVADILATCRPRATQAGDAIARRPGGPLPDAVLWFADAPVSAPLMRWVGRCPGPVARVSAGGTWRDPSFKTRLAVDAAPTETADALRLPPASAAWRERWACAVREAEAHLATADEHGAWEGPLLAKAIEAWPGDLVHVANSSAVRDVDTFGRLRAGERALCNRGVNGIDGTIATAAGEALALGRPILAVVGDLALAHDLGALLHTPASALVILAIDNGGGQIFRQLPVRDHPAFEEVFVTATPTDLGALAGATGWAYRAVGQDPVELQQALVQAYERGRSIVQLHLDPRAAFDARSSFWNAWR